MFSRGWVAKLVHCEKTFFVLAFHPKNPLLRIENPAVDI
jgi:hypothetical protein